MKHVVEDCFGPNCSVRFASDLLNEAEDSKRKDFSIETCGCLGFCEEGPNIVLDNIVRTDMTPEHLRSLINSLSDLSHLGIS